MASRYDDRAFITNTSDSYRNIFKKRGVKQIVHYASPEIKYPSTEDLTDLNIVDHIWRRGDHYYKLADFYYGDSTYWWVIAFFNQKPTEFHVSPGDVIYIPVPLEAILYSIGY